RLQPVPARHRRQARLQLPLLGIRTRTGYGAGSASRSRPARSWTMRPRPTRVASDPKLARSERRPAASSAHRSLRMGQRHIEPIFGVKDDPPPGLQAHLYRMDLEASGGWTDEEGSPHSRMPGVETSP